MNVLRVILLQPVLIFKSFARTMDRVFLKLLGLIGFVLLEISMIKKYLVRTVLSIF